MIEALIPTPAKLPNSWVELEAVTCPGTIDKLKTLAYQTELEHQKQWLRGRENQRRLRKSLVHIVDAGDHDRPALCGIKRNKIPDNEGFIGSQAVQSHYDGRLRYGAATPSSMAQVASQELFTGRAMAEQFAEDLCKDCLPLLRPPLIRHEELPTCFECQEPMTTPEWDQRHSGPDGEDIHEQCCSADECLPGRDAASRGDS